VQSHGGQPGSDTGQYNVPGHLAVYNDDLAFVADVNNRRVTLLFLPTIGYIGLDQIVSSDKLKWLPMRLYFDTRRRRLYIADNEAKAGMFTVGRVVVFGL